MKKKLLSILLSLVMVVGLLPTAVFAADEVAINETNFPDEKFRNYVITEFDKNSDSKLNSEEIAAVTKIEANNKGIKSLVGVGFFTALETLTCRGNELTGLDLSKNTALIELQCSNSKLQSLDLSQNTNLIRLYCGRNPLTTLDLSKNTKLKVLNCSGFANICMKLTELDLSKNTALESLDCSLNELKQLNVSGCTALYKLDCSGNQLGALDVSTNEDLIELLCSSNQLVALDVSKNTKLEKLYCWDNFLAALDVSKNTKLKSIDCKKNRLTSLDLDNNENITDVNLDKQQFYNSTLTAGGTFNLNGLPGAFDLKRAINWKGGKVNETTGILTVDADAEAVTYNYKTKSDSTEAKYLMPCKMQVRGGTTPPTPGTNTKVDVPTAKTNLVYNGKKQTGVVNGVGYTLTGNTATDAGTYTATATLATGYQWADGTTGGKNIAWTIRKADQAAPKAPELDSCDTTSITLKPVSGAQYSMDGTKWQPSPSFTGLSSNTSYTFYARLAETKNYNASPASAAANLSITGTGTGVASYPITVMNSKNGDVTASHKTASKGTLVTLTVKPNKGYVLDTLTVLDGNNKELKLTEKSGKFTFTMPSGKVTVSVAFKAEAPASENPFTDVPAGAYYEDAVVWAVQKGITSGTSAVTFDPDGVCTRAQAVTFLWRAAGSPEPKSATMPFTDIPAGSYFEKAVLWAVENGITKGTSDTTFDPDASCTRAQIVTFMWHANGSPAVSGNSAFNDVAADAYYAAAVAWAEKNGVTGGIGGGLFGSGNTCTRAQIVTFLYRAFNK